MSSTPDEVVVTGSVVVKVSDPTHVDLLAAAQGLSERLGVPVTLAELDDPPEMPTFSVTLRINPPNHPLLQELATQLSAKLGVPVYVRPWDEKEQ